MRIGLFITCLGETVFPETGRATVSILERLGHEVVFPAGQTCCGQMHLNSGYPDQAAGMLRRFVDVFGGAAGFGHGSTVEAVVAPSGSCVAMVREHYRNLAAASGDAGLQREVEALVPRVFELSELLVDELGVSDVGAYYPHRVVYHPSCHGLRTLKLGDKPLSLLRNVTGIELVDLALADSCCGFGGTFAVKNADTSAAMLADKMSAVLESGAEICTASDSSCLMHIGGGLARQRSGVRTVHYAEILAATESDGWVAPPDGVAASPRGAAAGGAAVTRAPEAGGTGAGGIPATARTLAAPDFPTAARTALADSQLRVNLAKATTTIRVKRAGVVAEMEDWEELREAGRRIKTAVTRHLDEHLLRLEASVTAAGGTVHWAGDGAAANRIVGDLIAARGVTEVVKVKSIVTDEIGLNAALEERGIHAQETDLAELINQLAGDSASHILVPAIHRNRAEIRDLFRTGLPDASGVSDRPAELAEAARRFLRAKFMSAEVAVSGANFAVADTGTICVVESEGNGRMCTTLPRTLITVMGIEKVLASVADLEVMLQLLPRSSTAERMNPYTSLWTGVRPGDGPEEFHLVLLDAGRTDVLADETGRQALHCIRCSACLNVCPVYERTGGHAYGSVYPGPIGAILSPQLAGLERHQSLPWASSLCGACYEVCPVKINIPEVLVHLRGEITRRESRSHPGHELGERAGMTVATWFFGGPRRFALAGRLVRWGLGLIGRHRWLERLAPPPLAGWTAVRELPPPPEETFSDWWRGRE